MKNKYIYREREKERGTIKDENEYAVLIKGKSGYKIERAREEDKYKERDRNIERL